MRYEYLCTKCGEMELEHSMNEEIEFCPKCAENNEETPIKKLISKSSFILTGSGWSRDNYS